MDKNEPKLKAIAQSTGSWESYFLSFSKQEQLCLRVLGRDSSPVDQVFHKSGGAIAYGSCNTVLSLLRRHGVLAKEPKHIYRVVEADFAEYLATMPIEQQTEAFSQSKTIDQAQSIVSKALKPFLRRLVEQGVIEDAQRVEGAVVGCVEKILKKEIG